MTDDIKIKIVELYSTGKGSTSISKELGLSKKSILKVLNDNSLIRKRDRCSTLTYIEKDGYYIIERICPLCKNVVESKSKHKTIACRNHFNTVNKNSVCKKCVSVLQSGEGNPFYGRKHTYKSKNQISKSRKNKGVGENNSMSNPEHRKKASENLKKRWDNGELEHVRKFMSDLMKKTIKEGKIKSTIKSKDESIIKNMIEQMGYEVIHSYRIETKICDLYIPELNLIIEYNGDYWHCNPKKYHPNYYNRKKSKYAWELWEYDNSKVDLIRNLNYNLEIVWESDFHYNKQIIIDIIQKYANN